MAFCVRSVPGGSVIGMSAGNMVISTNPMLVEDSACASGLKVYKESEITALLEGAGSGQSPDASTDPQRIEDMTALFYLFLAVLVAVWGCKQLLNLFTGDTEK